MNMVNFLDGMDGLAAGICAIAGSTFAIIALSLGKPEAAILSAIVAGACFGFLRHNFYPARIFMGDSGAMLLGFMLAAVSIQGLLKTAATVALFFPLLVLAIPIVDTSFVVREAAEVRAAAVRGRPHAPPSPFATSASRSGGPRCTCTAGARSSPAPPSRRGSSLSARTASGTCGRRRGRDIGLVALADVALHRLPARDRQAREPADPPPRAAGGARAEDRLSASSVGAPRGRLPGRPGAGRRAAWPPIPSSTSSRPRRSGGPSALRELLDEDPSLANAWAEDGFQPLGLASFFGHVEAARLLVERGAEVNSASRNDFKVMPLHSAAATGDPEVALRAGEAAARARRRPERAPAGRLHSVDGGRPARGRATARYSSSSTAPRTDLGRVRYWSVGIGGVQRGIQ